MNAATDRRPPQDTGAEPASRSAPQPAPPPWPEGGPAPAPGTPRGSRGFDVAFGVVLALLTPLVFTAAQQLSRLLRPPLGYRASAARELATSILDLAPLIYAVVVPTAAAWAKRPGIAQGFLITLLVAVAIFLVTCFALLSRF